MKQKELTKTTILCLSTLYLLFVHLNVFSQNLIVGTNYHPHDSNPAQWKKDIDLMKEAGFKVVRMGHLAWDSYEPTEGRFEFEWFDQVMDMMHAAGIKVILDIAVRPAPIWLHHKFPSINITDANGNLQYPNTRYMEDVGDPDYQRYAIRFTDKLTKRYANHPAVLSFGVDNESGYADISYSETVRKRFIEWLKIKYRNTENLNKAWAGQRWSRKIGNFNEIGLPMGGSPERVLDFRRFISDETNGFMLKIIDKTKQNAPKALLTSNLWYYTKKYFDYPEIAYSGKINRAGCGFYPGYSLLKNQPIIDALFGIVRIQFENTTPFWCVEFTSMNAVPNAVRKYAYASLMYGNQMVCGWTWQSMCAGEEQLLQGMIDWDGLPNRKFDEYKKIASEFKKIEPFGFPYKAQAEIGMAFSFPSQIVSRLLPELHDNQLQECFNLFYKRNIDIRLVDISRSTLDYKLLILPSVAVIDSNTATKIRNYVQNGGTVIMTTNSAMFNEHGQVFASTRPGNLDDVFGIRIAGFEQPELLNELSIHSLSGNKIMINYKEKNIICETNQFDIVESRGADIIASITGLDKNYPIVTKNSYGKGCAIYVGLDINDQLFEPIIDELINELSIKKGPNVPKDVMARFIDKNHILYLNMSNEPKEIKISGNSRSVLFDQDYINSFTLAPNEPDFIEIK